MDKLLDAYSKWPSTNQLIFAVLFVIGFSLWCYAMSKLLSGVFLEILHEWLNRRRAEPGGPVTPAAPSTSSGTPPGTDAAPRPIPPIKVAEELPLVAVNGSHEGQRVHSKK